MKITFGKFKGRLLEDVIKIAPNYIKWAVNKGLIKELPKHLKL